MSISVTLKTKTIEIMRFLKNSQNINSIFLILTMFNEHTNINM